jgi:hypothetical protein
MGHFDGGVCSVDLHPASLHFCRGYSGPWRADRSGNCEIFVLGSAEVLFDVLVPPVQERLDLDFWSSEMGVFPINVGFEVLTPWVAENESVFA